ncbi:MAG TPA: AAA family ATPase, partial [Gaiellaceae bacterium]|nr:AAA family ATPase [Gaiellaceae bacterium]
MIRPTAGIPSPFRCHEEAMRIRRIQITHLLCFRQLDLPLQSPLQVVAGPNNAGKSSLVRILEVFFSDPSDGDLMPLFPVNDYYREMGTRTLSTIRVTFSDLTSEEHTACVDAVSQRSGELWLWLELR